MLKFIDKVTISFAPLARSSRSARTFLFMVSADSHKLTNPKATIVVNQSDAIAKPSVEVIYKDKKKILLDDCSSFQAAEIISRIGKHSRKLQLEEDINSSE
ncbi:hypothetical protein DFJ73DRAFT_821217 [Zopfochytrium polystomum]|nr:hypothetical protein DFJ73DRAFT_821217 [Zopfochytrium polystomum]